MRSFTIISVLSRCRITDFGRLFHINILTKYSYRISRFTYWLLRHSPCTVQMYKVASMTRGKGRSLCQKEAPSSGSVLTSNRLINCPLPPLCTLVHVDKSEGITAAPPHMRAQVRTFASKKKLTKVFSFNANEAFKTTKLAKNSFLLQ